MRGAGLPDAGAPRAPRTSLTGLRAVTHRGVPAPALGAGAETGLQGVVLSPARACGRDSAAWLG